jgi:hypothetical protein
MPTIDFNKPIEVFWALTEEVTSARFLRAQIAQVGRYEIEWRNKRWTVDVDNLVIGPTEETGFLAEDFQVRNVAAN